MTTPTLPPTPDAGWLNAWSSVVMAIFGALSLFGAILGAIWKLMIQPIQDKITEHSIALAAGSQNHIDNLQRFSEIEKKLAAQPTKDDFNAMRREQREDHQQQMSLISGLSKRIDDAFGPR